MPESILIIAGENSGEKYGASLVEQYKKLHPNTRFFGIGGTEMKRAGVDILFSIEELSLVGIFEVLSHLRRIKKIFNHIIKESKKRSPSAAVLIDSPDFNLNLAKKLSTLSLPVLYYISPTIWAWRKRRLKKIKKYVSKMLLIFPFEKKIYRKNKIPAVYVGHPLIEKVEIKLDKDAFLKKYKLDAGKKIIAVLPGSRRSEIKYHSEIINGSIDKISSFFDVQLLLLQADSIPDNFMKQYFPDSFDYKYFHTDFYEAMAYSDIALSSCGTANLECALLETPVLSFYRLSTLTYRLGILFVKIKNYSIVNILAGRKVIPELIQNQFTPDTLALETHRILSSSIIQKKMITQFKRIKKKLGTENASQNAARELSDLIH